MQAKQKKFVVVDVSLQFQNASFSCKAKIKDIDGTRNNLEKYLNGETGTIALSKDLTIENAWDCEGVVITHKGSTLEYYEEWGNNRKVVKEFALELKDILDNFIL
nr:hypothetical protein [Marseillevirus cajuinensis]